MHATKIRTADTHKPSLAKVLGQTPVQPYICGQPCRSPNSRELARQSGYAARICIAAARTALVVGDVQRALYLITAENGIHLGQVRYILRHAVSVRSSSCWPQYMSQNTALQQPQHLKSASCRKVCGSSKQKSSLGSQALGTSVSATTWSMLRYATSCCWAHAGHSDIVHDIFWPGCVKQQVVYSYWTQPSYSHSLVESQHLSQDTMCCVRSCNVSSRQHAAHYSCSTWHRQTLIGQSSRM